jgi:hypothetical protein
MKRMEEGGSETSPSFPAEAFTGCSGLPGTGSALVHIRKVFSYPEWSNSGLGISLRI